MKCYINVAVVRKSIYAWDRERADLDEVFGSYHSICVALYRIALKNELCGNIFKSRLHRMYAREHRYVLDFHIRHIGYTESLGDIF